MNTEIKIEQILKDNLKDFLSNEIDKEIENKVNELEYILKNNKDRYIEHIMKNIRMLHERNLCNNRIDYKISFINEYVIKEKNNEI